MPRCVLAGVVGDEANGAFALLIALGAAHKDDPGAVIRESQVVEVQRNELRPAAKRIVGHRPQGPVAKIDRAAVARKLGLVEYNPTEAAIVRQPKARQATWTEKEVRRAIITAWRSGQYGVAVVLQLMYDTSLRPGDVRRLPPEAFSDDRVTLVTAKTDTPAQLPLWPETVKLIARYKAKLGAVPMPGQPLIRSERGRPFSKDHLTRVVRQVLTKAGIPTELQLRDLRRTASRERAEAEATAAELAAGTDAFN